MRGALGEAAWVAVATHAHWQAQFARLSARIGPQKAIVAIARKLLVANGHVLTAQVADVNAEVQAVGRKLLQWVSRCGTTPDQRRSRLALLQQYLDQLGLEVDSMTYKGQAYRFPRRTLGPRRRLGCERHHPPRTYPAPPVPTSVLAARNRRTLGGQIVRV